jgi:hypothetical protein
LLDAPTALIDRESLPSDQAVRGVEGGKMSTRRLRAVVARILLAGVAVLVWGVLLLATSNGDPTNITCDGQRMTSGDKCGNYRHGFQSYDEMVASKRDYNAWAQTYGPLITGLGVVTVVGCGVFLLYARTMTDPNGPTAASTSTSTGKPASGTQSGSPRTDPNWWSEDEKS